MNTIDYRYRSPFMNHHRILLVEDNIRLAKLIAEFMQKHGYEVVIEGRGDNAIARIIDQQPDVVILDLMLPGVDGLEVCRSVRPFYTGAILMLTAQDEDIDQIVGLELGADDYIVKPVEPRVLLARIKSQLRRSHPSGTLSSSSPPTMNTATRKPVSLAKIVAGALVISPQQRTVTLNNTQINMTTQEFDLLLLLANHTGNILTRDQLCQHLYGMEYNGVDRSIDILISRLRKLIKDDSEHPSYIKTVRNKGYLFVPMEAG